MKSYDTRDLSARSEEAARLLREAERLEHKRPIDFSEMALNPLHAQEARDRALGLLDSVPRLAGRPQMEMAERPDNEARLTQARMELLETLDEPNVVGVAASEQRAELAMRVGVLSAALDTAQSADAQGPIEKMLCSQMAAAHASGMDLLARIQEHSRLPIVEAARLANAASRLFESFQAATLCLQRLKTGGAQRVVVQYQQQVNVETGGQAMVGTRLGTGGRQQRKRKTCKVNPMHRDEDGSGMATRLETSQPHPDAGR
jgi:hypothetical protein